MFSAFTAGPRAITIQTQVASVEDLYRHRRLADDMLDRLDAIASRLSAPVLDSSDDRLVKQIEAWQQAVDRLRPRPKNLAMNVRCV